MKDHVLILFILHLIISIKMYNVQPWKHTHTNDYQINQLKSFHLRHKWPGSKYQSLDTLCKDLCMYLSRAGSNSGKGRRKQKDDQQQGLSCSSNECTIGRPENWGAMETSFLMVCTPGNVQLNSLRKDLSERSSSMRIENKAMVNAYCSFLWCLMK